MRMFLRSKEGEREITGVVTSVTLRGEYRSCCRSLDFGIVHSSADKRTWVVEIHVGDQIRMIEKDKVLFHGVVWTKNKRTDGNEIDFTCNDFGIYLKKNKGSYVFSKMTPEAIVKKVCGDFGIQTGKIASTGKAIKRNFLGVNLYDIIMTAYTVANDKKYFCEFQGEKLMVLEKGVEECTPLESGINLLTANVSETLNAMINRVRVYNKEDKLIREFQNEEDSKKYGYMTEIMRVTDNKEDFTQKAKKLLHRLDRKITVTNLGDVTYKTGRKVRVKEPYTGLVGIFYIDEDSHNWKNGIYTNRLVLNFENMMDEKESGNDGKK